MPLLPAQDLASAISRLPDHRVVQQGRGQLQTLRAEGRTSLGERSWYQHKEKEAESGQGRLSEGLTPQLESSRFGMTSLGLNTLTSGLPWWSSG